MKGLYQFILASLQLCHCHEKMNRLRKKKCQLRVQIVTRDSQAIFSSLWHWDDEIFQHCCKDVLRFYHSISLLRTIGPGLLSFEPNQSFGDLFDKIISSSRTCMGNKSGQVLKMYKQQLSLVGALEKQGELREMLKNCISLGRKKPQTTGQNGNRGRRNVKP